MLLLVWSDFVLFFQLRNATLKDQESQVLSAVNRSVFGVSLWAAELSLREQYQQ